MSRWLCLFAPQLALLAACGAPHYAAPATEPEISFEKHILPNGLTLILHEDHKAPIVAVNVWYHVGSKDERPGRTGFAHLFEHLMFNGSEHHDAEYFGPLIAVGASKVNGTTWYDRTNYFQNVPTPALDLALWLESDRMGHLLGALTQAKLDEQRRVVLNEKSQGENQPYGRVPQIIAAATYPPGHPYSWTSIGSEEDLNAATLDEVREWFGEHYGAANATLVIAGDIDPAAARKRVEHYFGNIASGPPRQRHQAWIAKMSGTKRMVLQDRVPHMRLTQVWNLPGFCTQDTTLMDLSSGILAGGKASRLYRRLVHEERLASRVSAYISPFEIASQFTLDAMLLPGADVKRVEKIIDEELATYLATGPTPDELRRAQIDIDASFVRGMERIDGFGGKSATLTQHQVYCGTPDHYRQELRWVRQAQREDLRRNAREWLSDGRFVLTVEPFEERAATRDAADRSRLPQVGELPALDLPAVQRARLSNGIEVRLAERHETPLVQMALLFDAGTAADPPQAPGTARMTLDMLDEGAGTRDALAVTLRKEDLAVEIGAQSNLDSSFVLVNSLTKNLPDSLALFADIVQRPRFDAGELERIKQRRVSGIRQEKSSASGIAARLYSTLLYGATHPYAHPGSGTEESVAALRVQDLRAFHTRWLRPDNARLVVVGDTTLAAVLPLLERSFGNWSVSAARGAKSLPVPAVPSTARVFLIDKPATTQTLLLAAQLAPPKSDPDDLALNLASSVLGGLFVSRLNLNLREDKHWTYGASSSLGSARGLRPFVVSTQVQQDRSADAVREIQRELRELLGPRPITAAELALAADNLVHGLPGDHETAGEVGASLLNILQYGLAETYYEDLIPRARALTPAQVNQAARRLVKPDALTWVIVGDLSKIEPELRALELGEVQVLDVEGRSLR